MSALATHLAIQKCTNVGRAICICELSLALVFIIVKVAFVHFIAFGYEPDSKAHLHIILKFAFVIGSIFEFESATTYFLSLVELT